MGRKRKRPEDCKRPGRKLVEPGQKRRSVWVAVSEEAAELLRALTAENGLDWKRRLLSGPVEALIRQAAASQHQRVYAAASPGTEGDAELGEALGARGLVELEDPDGGSPAYVNAEYLRRGVKRG